MAIDPNLLASLTAGATAGAKTANTASSTGIDWEAAKKKNQPGAWSLGQSIIDILSTGGYASAGITRKVGENVSAIQRGDLGGLLDLLNPLSVVPAAVKGVQERRTYSENLRNLGVEDKTATWLGLALDIGLDPTTYITGGTVAGVKGAAAGARLASEANKANAVVVRSAAEAAAENLPDVSRPFIPTDAPLTQGQKLGNYLTGVLRGYEFKKTERAAEISNKKLNKAIRKDAEKTGQFDLGDEAVNNLETASKSTSSALADDLALINRDRFMQAVAKSPILQAKYAKRLDKMKTQTARAEELRFVDPKTAKKTDAATASETAKVSQIEEAVNIDPTPATVKEVNELARPAILEEVENATVIANRTVNEEIAAALKKELGVAKKAVDRQLSKIKSSFSNLEKEVLDFASKVNDPATGKRLSKSAKPREELMEYIAKELGAGRIKLTANRAAQFAKAIGTTNDPGQSIVDLTRKTLVTFGRELRKLTKKEAEYNRILEEANKLPRGLESGFVNATSENTAAATGAVNPGETGRIVEKAMDLEGEVAASIDDIAEEALFNNPSATAKTPEELVDAATNLRLDSAEQFIDSIDFLRSTGSKTFGFRLESLLRSSIEEGSFAKFKELAAERGLTVDELLLEAFEGNKAIINDPRFSISTQAVKLDVINSEARFNTYTKTTNAERVYVSNKARTPLSALEEEAHIGRSGDSIFRLMNIPVRTEENILMQLRRDGAKKVGDKLSDGFVPQSVNITLSDISLAAIKAGKGDVFAAIRYPGSKYQNVMPSNIEYAFLTMNRYIELGEDIRPGSDAWNEIKKAFNEQYQLAGISGGKYGKRDVDEFFIPAAHLNPGVVTTKDKKKIQLKQIPDIDKKIDAAIQVMLDSATELRSLHAARAAGPIAYAAAEALPQARQLMLGLFEFFAAREEFMGNLETLAKASTGGVNAVATGVKGIPGFNQLKEMMKAIVKTSSVGAKAFKDQDIAGQASDLILNIFMKDLIGANKADLIEKLGPNSTMRLEAFLTQEVDALYTAVRTELDLTNAMGATRPSTKLTPKQTSDGKNARRRQNTVESEKSVSMAQAAIKNQEPAVTRETATPRPIPEDGGNLSTNLVAQTNDPILSGLENIATVEIKKLTDLKLNQRFMVAFSGRYGMGLGLKVVIGGIEYWNHSKVGWFNNALRTILEKNNKNLPEINNAFKIVQQWGREMAQRIEAGRGEISFAQWAQGAKLGNVNLEAAEDLARMVDGMFGVDAEGAAVGVLADSINQPYFADELNNMFGMRGFWEIGEEQAFKLPEKIGPMGVKYSWARADIDKMKSGSKEKPFDALTFLSNYASAMHAVQTRIGIGQSFSTFFGKTLQQIKDEGIDPSLYSKVDPEDDFGKFLDPDKLYDASELEKLSFLKNYITYERSFRGGMQRIVDISDITTSILKASHTTWRPGHHVTSIIGEAIMNSLAGVNSPKYYGNAWKLLTKFDPSQYKGDPNVFRQYMEAGSPKGLQVKLDEVETVGYVNSKTGKRTVVSDEQVYFLAERLGILTRGGASTVEDVDLRGVADLGSGVTGAFARANSKLANISSHRDNYFRMAHFIKEIEKGGIYGSLEEAAIAAAKTVTTYHPTIGGLSAFERKYMRRAVFFYTWQRIAATKVFQLMIEKPGAIIVPSKIQYAFAEANGFNPESFGDPWDPDGVYASWHTGSPFGPQFQGPAGKGDAWGFAPAVPQLDILRSLFEGYTLQPGQTGLDAITRGTQNLAGNNLSPLPKWFAELTTGNRVGTGGTISNPLEYAIDQVGGINTISKLTGIGQEEEKTLTPTEQAEKKARLLINWFTGQKLQDYTTSQTIKQWKTDQRMMMKKLTGQE